MPDDLTLGEDEVGGYARAELVTYGRTDYADWWTPEEKLLTRARHRAPDSAIFAEHPPYFWGARISNGLLDGYYTRMHRTSQVNYAADAEAGVAVMDSHKTGGMLSDAELNFGRSLTGVRVVPTGQEEDDYAGEVFSQAFTLSNFVLPNGTNTDSYIGGIRAGLHRDISIGFHKGQQICSICGVDMYRDFSCWHYPGLYYTKTDAESGDQGRRELCWASVQDSHLREWSHVYKGATPRAAVLKAQRRLEAGATDWRDAERLENLYGVRFRRSGHLFIRPSVWPAEVPEWFRRLAVAQSEEEPSPTPAPPAEPAAEPPAEPAAEPSEPAATPPPEARKGERKAMDPKDLLAQFRALLGAVPLEGVRGVAEGGELDALRLLIANREELANAAKSGADEVARLQPFEARATELGEALLEDVVKEGIRAQGTRFPADAMRRAYAHFTVAELVAERDRYREEAGAALPAGRRSRPDATENATVEDRAPAIAYT